MLRKRAPSGMVGSLLSLLLLAILLAVPSGADDDATDGNTLFISRGCLGCHGVSGRGGVGPALAHTSLTFDAFLG